MTQLMAASESNALETNLTRKVWNRRNAARTHAGSAALALVNRPRTAVCELQRMTSQRKQRPREPSIVVDEALSSPSWCSEETVVFRREMLDELLAPPKKKSPSVLLLGLVSLAVILGAVALRLLLRH